jgi:hypothetical protein
LFVAPTELQGVELTGRNLPINRAIITFIKLRLLDRRDEYIWAERKSMISG